MTASPPPPPSSPSPSPSADELASAYLDDEVTPAERAQVETDPALLARVDELRMVRGMLASPVEAAGSPERDAAIRAAMDVGSESRNDPAVAEAAAAGGSGPAAPVLLSSRRRGPGRSGRIGLAVLGAVAAAAIAVVALSTSRTDNHDTTSSASLAPAAASAPAVATVAGGNDAGGSATTAASAAGATDVAAPNADAGRAATSAGLPALGIVDDADGLRAALAAAPTPLAAAEASSAAEACAVAGGQLVGTVVWQGTPAFVYLDGGGHADVVRQVDCIVLADVPLS